MNAEAFEKELLGKSGLIKRICYFDVTDSTNIRAKNDSDAGNGTLFVADMQEKGRGRMGRIWQSEQGCGIYMSVLLKPKIQLDNVSQLTLAAGLAVTNVLAGYLPGVMINGRMMWCITVKSWSVFYLRQDLAGIRLAILSSE